MIFFSQLEQFIYTLTQTHSQLITRMVITGKYTNRGNKPIEKKFVFYLQFTFFLFQSLYVCVCVNKVYFSSSYTF